MNDFKTVQNFLDGNDVTAKEMDVMWAFMYDKNWIVKNLTDAGKGWLDLNTVAMKSLINEYAKAEGRNNG